ncbi:MAG: hypothetical protein IJS03_07580 [Eubacterium sp.]|nr:hypothetical protein [Eubacterium sp.]
MNEKQIAKRYLLSLFALYFVGAGLLLAFIFALSGRAEATTLDTKTIWLLALLLPLLPCSSYAGFCTAFLKVGELSKRQMVLLVVLFPLVLAALTLYGAVMLLPSVARYLTVIFKKEK